MQLIFIISILLDGYSVEIFDIDFSFIKSLSGTFALVVIYLIIDEHFNHEIVRVIQANTRNQCTYISLKDKALKKYDPYTIVQKMVDLYNPSTLTFHNVS